MRAAFSIKKLIFTLLLVITISACIVPAFADSYYDDLIDEIYNNLLTWIIKPTVVNDEEDEFLSALNNIKSVWRTSLDNRKQVDYEVLSDIYARLLARGIPCELSLSRGAAAGYYIRGTGDISIWNGKGRYSIDRAYLSDTDGYIFYAHRPTSDTSTTTPSTTPPTTSASSSDAGTGANGSYIPTHVAASTDSGLLKQIAQYTHEIWFWADLINDNLRDVRRYTYLVYANVGRFVDGMNNITTGIYKQIDLLTGYLPRLDDIYNRLFQIQSAAWASVDVENRLLYSLETLATDVSSVIVDGAVKVTSSPDPAVAEAITGIQNTLTSVISNGKVLVDNSDVVTAIQSIPAFDDADIITAINNIPTYDDTNLLSAVTTISDQITEQFGEYDSTYSFPNFSSSGQSSASNKTVSGVLPSAFTSIDPDSQQLLYSPSGTLTLSMSFIYNGSGACQSVYCYPYIHPTYGLGYQLRFCFYSSSNVNTSRTLTLYYPQVRFVDYSGKTLILQSHSGSVHFSSGTRYAYAYSYYFPRWDASGNWLGWSGQNDTFSWTSSSYEPSKRVYLTPPESGTYYIYGTSDTAVPVVYASRFTGFLQSQTDRVVNAVGSIPAPNDYTAQLTAVTSRMDDILAQLQSTSGSATCEHTYSQHMEQEANCILPGLMISTCSKCGDSSSEIVDPLGHDWQCTSHVDAVTDPDTGEETSSAYDIYTCSRCGDTYEDHTGTGAPDEDYSNTTISQLVVKVFSKLGTFVGKLLGSVVHLFDKAVTAVDDLATKFNDYVEQIKGFGEDYPIWLSGFWGIIPAELQVALTFAVICMALGVVGRKLFFS